jgi:hypothetical protein
VRTAMTSPEGLEPPYGAGSRQVERVPGKHTHATGSPCGPVNVANLPEQSGQRSARCAITGTASSKATLSRNARINAMGFKRLPLYCLPDAFFSAPRSSFFIEINALVVFSALTGSGSLISSPKIAGTICQETPNLS